MSLRARLVEIANRHMPTVALNYLKRVDRVIDNATFKPRIVKHTYGTLRLMVSVEDREGRSWYDRDWEPLPEIKILETGYLRSGATVFEIGAHQGVVAMILADRVRPAGRVVAVEADEWCARIARKNLALNQFEDVTLLHAAGAATSGIIEFTENSRVDRGEPGETKHSVKAVTIDELVEEFGLPNVLFIDVEGYECQVLNGAQKSLQNIPDLFVEVHVGVGLEAFGGSLEEVLQLVGVDREVYVANPHGGEFVPIHSCGDITKERFFLVAMRRA